MAKSFRDKVDDYKNTVFAIIGFGNLFRYDNKTKSMNETLKMAQGRKFKTSSSNRISPNNEVTPDLCIQLNNENGIVSEVKISFPQNQEYWLDDFKQLMSYDDNLEHWWTSDLGIRNHSIVLLPHQSRSVKVKKYFEQQINAGQVQFVKPFSIVEFNRSDQSNGYYFFRLLHGNIIASHELTQDLEEGIQVPTEKLMLHYEKHKLYDSKPPMPYFLHIIWENVILQIASELEGFAHARRNRKIDISTDINSITDALYENCSFKGFNFQEDEHQPRIPLTSWVREAVDALVKFNYAKWEEKEKGTCTIFFKKSNDAVFENFINLCTEFNIDTEDIDGSIHQEVLFKS